MYGWTRGREEEWHAPTPCEHCVECPSNNVKFDMISNESISLI